MWDVYINQISDNLNSKKDSVITKALKKNVGDDVDLMLIKPRLSCAIYGTYPDKVYHFKLDGECILIMHEPKSKYENDTLSFSFKYKII